MTTATKTKPSQDEQQNLELPRFFLPVNRKTTLPETPEAIEAEFAIPAHILNGQEKPKK